MYRLSMINSNKEHERVRRTLPHLNFDDYEIVETEEKKNEKRHQKVFPTRVYITIQEKNSPPDDSGNRHAH